jgi:hypothetical protein
VWTAKQPMCWDLDGLRGKEAVDRDIV